MKTHFVIIAAILASTLMGCNLTSPKEAATAILTAAPTLEFFQPTVIVPATPTTPATILPPTTPNSTEATVLHRAEEVVVDLKNKDMVSLTTTISPRMGLRFSPYAAVQDSYQVFRADKLSSLMADPTIYTWGAYDGTGESINLIFADYYSKFVYDVDFANAPQIALNHRLGVSTTLDNTAEFYPGAMIVEYYFPGFDPKLEGMDWRSLRLVFLEENSTWYLVCIIHDQWTT